MAKKLFKAVICGLSKYYKDTQTTQRRAKTHKDAQRRAKTRKEAQRRGKPQRQDKDTRTAQRHLNTQ